MSYTPEAQKRTSTEFKKEEKIVSFVILIGLITTLLTAI